MLTQGLLEHSCNSTHRWIYISMYLFIWLSVVSSTCAGLFTAAVLQSLWKQSSYMDCCVDPYGEKYTCSVTGIKCFPSWTSECRSAYHFLHSTAYRRHSSISNEASSSLHCLMFLSRRTSLLIISLPPYIQISKDTIWFAGSLIYFNIQIIIILVFMWFHWIFSRLL